MQYGENFMSIKPIYLGVNIDHVATVRQARGTVYPDPLEAALLAEKNGADGITMHLREDRRHIQDHDVIRVKQAINIPLNFEMAITEEIVLFAEKLSPPKACLVPEKRTEVTTEGGIDVVGQFDRILEVTQRLTKIGCEVSLFIDPDLTQIAAAKKTGAPVIEIHTGAYADAKTESEQSREYQRIVKAAEYADNLGLIVNAGHGLHYQNTQAIAKIPQMHELNIGHAIVAHALMVGFASAVAEMKQLMLQARQYD